MVGGERRRPDHPQGREAGEAVGQYGARRQDASTGGVGQPIGLEDIAADRRGEEKIEKQSLEKTADEHRQRDKVFRSGVR